MSKKLEKPKTRKAPIIQALARHKAAAQAPIDARSGRIDDDTLADVLFTAESDALNVLAETPCTSDAEFVEKLRYLLAHETRIFGGPPDGSDKKDKRWLKVVLKHAHEPSLEQRIFDVLTAIPINIDNTKIREFSSECAKRRNEISHFGAEKHRGDYTDFIRDLEKKSAALSILYHMLILHEIGVDEKIFNWWIYEGYRSYPIKRTLVEVGLLDKSVLKTTPSPPVAGGLS